MIWATTASLCILAPEIIQQQKSVPFPSELARSDGSWTNCGCKCDCTPPNISPPLANAPSPIHSTPTPANAAAWPPVGRGLHLVGVPGFEEIARLLEQQEESERKTMK